MLGVYLNTSRGLFFLNEKHLDVESKKGREWGLRTSVVRRFWWVFCWLNPYTLDAAPLTVTVTTRIIAFLVGDPYKPSFPTVTVRGPHPTYTRVFGKVDH